MEKNENIIVKLSFQFAKEILALCAFLEEKNKFIIANQLLKSGTSICANINEAQHAESRSDFIHKLKIAAKEAEETKFWLLLIQESKYFDVDIRFFDQLTQIQKLLSAIISSTKRNQ